MEQNGRIEILALHHLRKTFGDTVALDDVHFNLFAGEVHCLVGENGAGKSTLIKILSGAERADQGSIVAFGQEYTRFRPRESLAIGITTIYQDVELVTSLTVADNIFLGHEIKTNLGLIDYVAQNRIARELLDSMNVAFSETALVEHLSPAQQQTLQIAKALHINSKIMIMDEPTSSLGIDETTALIKIIRKLTSQNVGVIYISHFLPEIFAIGDRITVLKDGKVVKTFEVPHTDLATVTKSMIGRERALFYDRDAVETGEVVLSVRHLSGFGEFENVSFELHRGEILGFGGIVGAGRTALMNTIFGADRRSAGEIILHGRSIKSASPRDAIEKGIAMIPEDRKLLALFELRSVLENIAIVINESNGLLLNRRREYTAVEEMVHSLRIIASGIRQAVGFLSGGNQQKAILARWLLSKAQIFIFDEPTKGVDIGAKELIYDLMIKLAEEGKSILMVSSDMPELISLSNRIAVMRNGKLVATIDARAVSEQKLLGYFLGIQETGGATNG